MLELLDSRETLPMLWRASLSDNPQPFIERARECLQNRVRFPNTLDEVQMLQTLEQSAFARYFLGCFWYSKRRYAEAVSCWQFTLAQEADFAPVHRLLGIYAEQTARCTAGDAVFVAGRGAGTTECSLPV